MASLLAGPALVFLKVIKLRMHERLTRRLRRVLLWGIQKARWNDAVFFTKEEHWAKWSQKHAHFVPPTQSQEK
jgi:hypothetical protein